MEYQARRARKEGKGGQRRDGIKKLYCREVKFTEVERVASPQKADQGHRVHGGNLARFLMLLSRLGTYQRYGLQVLKATCESHRERALSTLSLGIGQSECQAPRCTN